MEAFPSAPGLEIVDGVHAYRVHLCKRWGGVQSTISGYMDRHSSGLQSPGGVVTKMVPWRVLAFCPPPPHIRATVLSNGLSLNFRVAPKIVRVVGYAFKANERA